MKRFLKTLYKTQTSGLFYLTPILLIIGIIKSLIPLFNSNGPAYEALLTIINLLSALSYGLLSGFIALALAKEYAFLAGVSVGILSFIQNAGIFQVILLGFISAIICIWLLKFANLFDISNKNIFSNILIAMLSAIFTMLLAVLLANIMPYIDSFIKNYFFNPPYVVSIILSLVLGFMISYGVFSPLNKIAYIFGLYAILNNGQSPLMTAILVAGMTPAIGVGLSTLFFRPKFDNEVRKKGFKSILLGLIFITEGILPFYLKGRKLVLTSSVIGSVVAAFIVSFFQVSTFFVHGGIFSLLSFIFFDHLVLMYFLIAILVGSLITALITGFFWVSIEKLNIKNKR